MLPDAAGTRARTLESTQWHTDNCSSVASTHVTQHATANMPYLQAHEALSDPSSRPASVHPAAHANAHAPARARTHARTHARAHTRTHTHTLLLVFGMRVTMCSPTSRYPPATDESYIIHRTIALCSVCSFSSVLNGNVGCSAHLRTAAERHTVRV